MNTSDLDGRITAFNRESRKQTLWILLFPLIVLFAAYGCTVLNIPIWGLLIIMIVSTVAMSVLLTRLVDTASTRVGLVCPHCGASLGGYIKYLKKDGLCPKCSKSVLDLNSSAVISITSTSQRDRHPVNSKITVFTLGNALIWITGTVCAGLGAATFKPHLGASIVEAIPALVNKPLVWGLVIVGFLLLTIALIRTLLHLKRQRTQSGD